MVKNVNVIQASDPSNLGKKADFNTNFNEIEKKITDQDQEEYITTQEFNKLIAETFAARLAQANLASKNYLAVLVKMTGFDNKLKKLNEKLLQVKQNM